MLKKLMLGTAISALALSTALAQSPTAPSPSDSPAASSPSASSPSKPADTNMNNKPMQNDAAKSGTDATKSTSAQTPGSEAMASAPANAVVASQSPDQWLASKFDGTDVVGTDDKKIGDVSDILFDKQGKIEAFVISVGGFLGVGSKEVALPPAAFQSIPGQNAGDAKLKLAMTKEELQNAAEFKRYEAPSATPTAGQRPAGGGLTGSTPRPSSPSSSQ